MITTLNTPLFMDSLIQFIQQFIPSLTIHRLHVQEQTSTTLKLGVEMTNGQTLWTSVYHYSDRLHLQMDYGLQRVELWLFANFPALKTDCIHQIPMDGIVSQHVQEDGLQLRGESGLFDDSLVGLASEMNLSWMELEEILLCALRDVRKERILVLSGDVGEDPSTVERCLPISQPGLSHPMFRPGTVHGKFEETL